MAPHRIDYLLQRFGDFDPGEEPQLMMQAFYRAMYPRELAGPETFEAFLWFREGWIAQSRTRLSLRL